jgi:hypothetical protein
MGKSGLGNDRRMMDFMLEKQNGQNFQDSMSSISQHSANDVRSQMLVRNLERWENCKGVGK